MSTKRYLRLSELDKPFVVKLNIVPLSSNKVALSHLTVHPLPLCFNGIAKHRQILLKLIPFHYASHMIT